uniref:Uncharacterized protein n=1 Tax=Anguilla anguilla TaxID=7936 RepID=A0A0E9WL31_ANGAN
MTCICHLQHCRMGEDHPACKACWKSSCFAYSILSFFFRHGLQMTPVVTSVCSTYLYNKIH